MVIYCVKGSEFKRGHKNGGAWFGNVPDALRGLGIP